MGGASLPGAHPQVLFVIFVRCFGRVDTAFAFCPMITCLVLSALLTKKAECSKQAAANGSGSNCRLIEGGGGFDDHVCTSKASKLKYF
jgi:hypothetical protein